MQTTTAAVGHGPYQTARKLVILAAVVLSVGFLFVAESRWPDGSFLHEGIEWAGLALIVVCILGRTWSALYIGGRKNYELIQDGPYSICRHPLYLFSIIGGVGVGAQFGSFVVAVVCGVFTWAVFLWTARREETAMIANYGDAYRAYVARVPRFLPELSLWKTPETLVVYPRLIRTTLFDSAIFLVAIPVVEYFEYLHEIGALSAWVSVP